LFSKLFRRLGLTRRKTPGAEDPASRQEQIDRLLKLLQRDPEAGLRYALPLAGPAHRGVAPPSNQLARRNVDFDLGRLGGGQPADPWQVSPQQFEDLRRHYRDLANREIRLGRHRRAAYIFAHLLDDLSAAAGALASGEHWREAAALYRDRLNRPQVAAECLEKGGLWTEAIEAYQVLKDFAKVGDLYQRIDRPEEAAAAFRQAVQKCLAARDYIGASRLLENKLHAPDEAVEQLAAGWPSSSQAALCLQEMFRILGAQGRHDETARRIEQIEAAALPAQSVPKAVKTLADLAGVYPDPAIRTLAADRARVAAGQSLAQVPPEVSQEILRDIARLAPQDRLLDRDCDRFSSARRSRRPSVAASIRRVEAMTLVCRFELPERADWTTALSTDDACYFAGYDEKLCKVGRWLWKQAVQDAEVVSWPISPGLVGASILLCPPPSGAADILAHVVGGADVPQRILFRPADEQPPAERIVPHRAFTPQTVGIARSPDGLLWLVQRRAAGLVLSTYTADSMLMGSYDVPLPNPLDGPAGDISDAAPIWAGPTHIFLGLGDSVLAIQRGVGAEILRTPSTVRGFCAPPEEFPGQIVIRCEHHVLAWWHGGREHRLEELCDSLHDALCGFTRAGHLVLMAGRRYEIYKRGTRNFELSAASYLSSESAMAVLTAPTPDQVLVCGANGEMLRFRVL
jgi:hypothetical protein